MQQHDLADGTPLGIQPFTPTNGTTWLGGAFGKSDNGATIGATREAGVTSGGEFALDGLVRAFVGAGGRTVLASHWPVPDDFDATGRLVSGLFAEDGRAVAEALQASQEALMDDPKTSHPFYWSAFAVVGDGAAHLSR